MSVRTPAVFLSVCFAFGATLALQPVHAQQQKAHADSDKERAVNEKVGNALKDALSAAKAKKYDAALAQIKQAEAAKKTPYEGFKINETLAFIYANQRKYASLADVYEKMLQTPQFMTPQEKASINAKTIAQIYAAAGQFPKTIEYGKRWLDANPTDADMLSLLGQSYYKTKDYKSCKSTMGAAISTAERSGKRPEDKWLEFTRYCSDALGDTKTSEQALEKLCRYYPKAEYWRNYITTASRGATELADFHWSRLKEDVGVLKDADDYSNYAQQAMLQYGSAAEGLRVVEEGFDKHVLGSGQNKLRHDRLLQNAKELAEKEKASIPQLTSEAEQDPTGKKYATIGEYYFGVGQYDQAIDNLQKAIKKDALKNANSTKLTLGVAQLKKGQRDSARATFKSLSSDPSLGKVADAWLLRSYN